MSSAETDPSCFAAESIGGSCTIRIQLWTIPIFAFHRPLQKNFRCPAFFPRCFFEQRNPYARTWLVRFHCRRAPQGLGAFGSGRMLYRPVRLRSPVHGEQDQRTASQVRRPHRRKAGDAAIKLGNLDRIIKKPFPICRNPKRKKRLLKPGILQLYHSCFIMYSANRLPIPFLKRTDNKLSSILLHIHCKKCDLIRISPYANQAPMRMGAWMLSGVLTVNSSLP